MLVGSKTTALSEMRMFIVECAFDPLIPKFLRVTSDIFLESTDWCVHAQFGATSNTLADPSK